MPATAQSPRAGNRGACRSANHAASNKANRPGNNCAGQCAKRGIGHAFLRLRAKRSQYNGGNDASEYLLHQALPQAARYDT
jgi:hypothetical protein